MAKSTHPGIMHLAGGAEIHADIAIPLEGAWINYIDAAGFVASIHATSVSWVTWDRGDE